MLTTEVKPMREGSVSKVPEFIDRSLYVMGRGQSIAAWHIEQCFVSVLVYKKMKWTSVLDRIHEG